jgi:glycosyltransferase involved in cell wall biosynthesis
MSGSKTRVAVIYDGFPHYRKGIIEALAASDRYEFYFFGDPVYRASSVKTYEFGQGVNFTATRGLSVGPFFIQTGILRGLLRNKISHCIFLGNPWFLSYWVLVPLLRLLGKKVYFWSHGWISQNEPRLRETIKQVFFKTANALLLYGSRAKQIAIARGFSARRLHVIHNSLDYAVQKLLFDQLEGMSQRTLRAALQLPLDGKMLICTARVTQKCRFDLLLQAVGRLKKDPRGFFVVIVGDGPEREPLAKLADALGVTTRFWGECYEEATLAKLYKASDLTISPGKVGLTALHSMAYGTPVISHDNLDHQMPEYEAIVPGETGGLFVENSSEDLAKVIYNWFESHEVKPERACVARIETAFTPSFQRHAIEAALVAVESAR